MIPGIKLLAYSCCAYVEENLGFKNLKTRICSVYRRIKLSLGDFSGNRDLRESDELQ